MNLKERRNMCVNFLYEIFALFYYHFSISFASMVCGCKKIKYIKKGGETKVRAQVFAWGEHEREKVVKWVWKARNKEVLENDIKIYNSELNEWEWLEERIYGFSFVRKCFTVGIFVTLTCELLENTWGIKELRQKRKRKEEKEKK